MKNDFGKVAVLYGGDSSERSVSLLSGKAVYDALIDKGIDAHLVDTVNKEAVFLLNNDGFDRAFIMLHGKGGEDGQIQAILKWMGLPFTGSDVLACAVAMDKILTKRIWQSCQLPVLEDLKLSPADECPDFAILTKQFQANSFVVKPVHDGSSIGISKVSSQEELSQALSAINHDEIMIEPWVEGRELTVAIIDKEVLPIVEIVKSDVHHFYDYQAKYIAEDMTYLCPAPIAEDLTKKISDIALKAFKAVDGLGWGRVDIMLDENDHPWLLEVNLAPGMTSHSLLPMAAKQKGIDFNHLVLRLLSQTVK